MNRILVNFFIFSLFFISCSDKQNFIVEGTVSESKGNMIYLEQLNIERIRTIDSVKLTQSGRFSFKVHRPSTPNFYRLRIKNKSLLFPVDSVETIQISATLNCLHDDYKIKGSESIKSIEKLRLSRIKLQKTFDDLQTKCLNADVNLREQKIKELNKAIAEHKRISRNVIYENPWSTAAYYALFQKVNGSQLFDPTNENDLKCYSVVANAYGAFYPHSIRGKHLTSLVLNAKQTNRSNNFKQILLDKRNHIVDISLPNINGVEIALSSLKGQVVLVGFCYYKSDLIADHLLSLKKLHKEYITSDFEIYCISFDSDIDFWKKRAKNLAWICVHEDYSINSYLLTLYNVEQLPTFFLIDKEGAIISRHTVVDEKLYNSIDQLLSN